MKQNNLQNNQKTVNEMAIANSYLSIIILNLNELNSTIKNIEWLGKTQDSTIYCLQEFHFSLKTHIDGKLKNGQRYFKQMVTTTKKHR